MLTLLVAVTTGIEPVQAQEGQAGADAGAYPYVETGPGPDALYDAYLGEPEALVPPSSQGTIFPGLQPPWRQKLAAYRTHLFDKHGLTFFLSYQQATQYATPTVPGVSDHWAIGGWLAVGGTWTPLKRSTDWQGTLVVRLGWRGPFGDITWPAPFGPLNLGSAWSGYVWTNWNAVIAMEDLFWEQRLGPTFTFQVGNLGPQGVLNTFRFKDARNNFSASLLNFAEMIPWPAFGLGASFRWRPGFAPGSFVNGTINDMNGNPGENEDDFLGLNWSHLSIDQLFVGAEIGHRWQRSNGEFDLVSVNLFHAGTRETFLPDILPNEAGWGFKINLEKQFGQFVGFGSYTYNTARGGGISTTFMGNTVYVGGAYLRPFGNSGSVGLTALWTRPFKDFFPGSGQRDQYGLDAYWNIAVSPNSTVTPGAQLIIHPSFNPAADVVFMPTVLFRVFL